MAEKYQARSNNEEKDEKKLQEERNVKNNANTINNAADVAIASGHPYAVVAGLAVKGLDKVTKGKSTEMLSKGVTKSLKYSPNGKQTQQASNILAESGAGNIIGKAASLKGGKGSTGEGVNKVSSNVNYANNPSTTNASSNISKGGEKATDISKKLNDTSNNSSKKENDENNNSLLGDLGKDGIGKMLFKSVGKKYVIIACAGFFVFLILMTAVVSAKDFGNLELTNKNSSIVSRRGSSSVANLSEGLETVANWYIENVYTYQDSTSGATGHRKYYQTPFGTRQFGDDCTEFVTAYMSYICGTDLPESYSGDMVDPNGSWAQTVGNCNWKAYSSDEIGSLQTGDVLVAHAGALYSTKGHHAEVYIDESHTFGWGSIKKSYPTSNTISTSTEGGHVHFRDSGHDYITVYRYEGTFSGNSSLNAQMMNDSSFNHGTKDKNNQKYIMLHDTEMSASAADVVKSWINNRIGVAAHFVIDKDGTIIQAVDLDVIAHHAGPGGPGDYDAKFGVGNNDGKGSGDDLVGNPTGTGNYANYTSYGMNSYSIGIEMCHVNGESYPEEQLNALDNVIAYIDSYYGFESTIIDHKEWRPSNSDTDANFATYLNNYKTLRHH